MKKSLPINLVIISPPGGGKSTQSQLLKKHFSFSYVMTGDLVRRLAKKDRKVQKRMLEGIPQPDEVVIQAINQELTHQPPILVDTLLSLLQIRAFEKKVKSSVYLLSIKVGDGEVVKRIKERAKKEKRLDDTPEIIKKRIQEYKVILKPIKDYFRKNKRLIEVNGNPAPFAVSRQIIAKVESL